jgi:glucose/arabinose dehydrogenase
MRGLVVVLACAVMAGGCGSTSPPSPPSMPQPPPGSEQISGNERIGWDQVAATAADLESIRYLVYVDDASGVDLQSVTCGTTPGPSGFPCNARLPTLTAGAHTLTLSAYLDGTTRLESPRSGALTVFVVAQAAITATSALLDPSLVAPADGVRLRARVVAVDLDDPTDMTLAPDGRVLVAERRGIVRTLSSEGMLIGSSVVLPDALDERSGGLLAIALDPDFGRNRRIFAALAAGAGHRLVRFRAAGTSFLERVTLMDAIGPAAERAAASLRFGPDRRLYLAVDDGGDARRAGDLGSFSGKVLRLNDDATTPPDQAGGSPVYGPGQNAPRAIAWDGDESRLWVGGDHPAPDGAPGSRLDLITPVPSGGRRGSVVLRYLMPPGTSVEDLAFYQHDRIAAFRGDLLVADDAGRSILRVRFDPSDRRVIARTERLLAGVLNGARALAVGSDGSIYVCTADALIRLDLEM